MSRFSKEKLLDRARSALHRIEIGMPPDKYCETIYIADERINKGDLVFIKSTETQIVDNEEVVICKLAVIPRKSSCDA